MIRKILILLLGLAAGMSFAAQPSPAVEIVSVEFGTFDDSNPREVVFAPTDVVPHKVDQRYGWVIEVRTTKRTLSVREEYVLPVLPSQASAPKATDPVSESLEIPTQRRSQVSQRQLVPVDGKIYGEWSIGPREPAGHRHLLVIIEDQPSASFEYDVK